MALAPPKVAISSASGAGKARGLLSNAFCSTEACRISRKESMWLCAPSSPRATLTPILRSSATGAKPDDILVFDEGQCTTCVPVSASTRFSSSSSHTQCASSTSSPVYPSSCRYSTLRIWRLPSTNAISPLFSEAWVCRRRPFARAKTRAEASRASEQEGIKRGATA